MVLLDKLFLFRGGCFARSADLAHSCTVAKSDRLSSGSDDVLFGLATRDFRYGPVVTDEIAFGRILKSPPSE
jgi:hypothetical protein